ncbi:MAG: WYL domain-containing transcriptional regulator [Clostridia bacterium]
MAKGTNQKIKLVKILEILRNESDEFNPMSTQRLITRLAEEGVGVERKSVYADIEMLNEFGYEIMTVKTNTNSYYVEDRAFNLAEIKILLDAVQSARFLTDSKTIALSNKIAYLAGKNRGEILKRNLIFVNAPKHTNEKIFYSIDSLNESIAKGKKVSFKYFDYNTKCEHVFRKGGKRYIVNPVSLVFSNDLYYLVCYNDKYKNPSTYRIDRMDDVKISKAFVSPLKEGFDVDKYYKKVFSMYGGKEQVVRILVDNSLVNAVVDKFGENVVMYDAYDGGFEIDVKVELSPTFYAWCFTYGEKMKIIEPKSVVDEMVGYVSNILKMYEKKQGDKI